MGSGESGIGENTAFDTIHGWVVGVTHGTSGTAAADSKSTGLGSMFVRTDTEDIYIRVA